MLKLIITYFIAIQVIIEQVQVAVIIEDLMLCKM